MRNRPAVMRRDQLPRHGVYLADGLIQKVECRLLVIKEAAVKARAAMARVGAGHRKAARQGRPIPCSTSTQGSIDAAIETAAPLKQHASVPLFGQGYGKADGIGLVVAPRMRLECAFYLAIGRCGGRGGLALGLLDLEAAAGNAKPCQRRALGSHSVFGCGSKGGAAC